MILVDSSVWIDHLRDAVTAPVSYLRSLISTEELLVGDLILCEVLQGLRSDAEARRVEDALREFEVVSLVDAELVVPTRQMIPFALSPSGPARCPLLPRMTSRWVGAER